LASFGDRFLAYLIDSAIFVGVGLVTLVPGMIVLMVKLANETTYNADGTTDGLPPGFGLAFVLFQCAFLLLSLVTTYLYYVEMMHRRGQTVGKRALRIRVMCVDPAAPLTRGVAAKRWAIQFVVPSVVAIFGLLDGLWQLWDKPFRQCLHDKVAGTVVVKLPA
jgi:uncharacterized RDD family membrane protein YckC